MLGLDPKYDFLRKFPQTQRQQKEGGDLWQIRSPAHWAPTPLGFSWKVGCLRRGQFRGSFAARAPLPGRLHLGWVGVSMQSLATAACCLGPSFHGEMGATLCLQDTSGHGSGSRVVEGDPESPPPSDV